MHPFGETAQKGDLQTWLLWGIPLKICSVLHVGRMQKLLKKDAENQIRLEKKQEYNRNTQKIFSKFGLLFGKVTPQYVGLATQQWDGTFYTGKVRSRHEIESTGGVYEQPFTSTKVSVQPGGGSWWGRGMGR